MKNETLLYSIIGLLVGVLLTTLYFGSDSGMMNRKYSAYQSNRMMHQMPDGSIMDSQTDMSQMMGSMASGLKGKTGDAFDKAFLSEMIVHHQGAVVMAQAVLKTSKRPELIKLANDIISAQTKEINMMKGWEKEWFSVQN